MADTTTPLGERVLQAVGDARQKGTEFIGGIDPNNALFNRANLLGGATLLPGAFMATQSVLEGRPLEAAAGGFGSVATGGLVAAVTGGLRQSKNPLAKAAGYILPGLAGAAGYGVGGVAEEVKAGMTGKPPTGKESRSAEREQARRDAELMIELQQRYGAAALAPYVSANKDLLAHALKEQFLNDQRREPMINRLNNQAMIRQQALMNTQASNYAMLGTVATAGKLATGAQAEAGATLRTALTSNPYANSVLQAPNISFG
jgi:hypothetical protein